MSRPAVNWRSAEQSFRRIAAASLLFYGALALAVNFLETPRPEREDFTQFSPRIARLIVESARPVPPPPPAEPKAPEAEEVQVAKETTPAPPPPKGPSPEEIRAREEAQRKKNMEVARKSGLLKLLNQNEPKGASGAEQEARLKNVFSEAGVLTHAPGSTGGSAPRAPLPAGNIDELVSRLEKSVKGSNPGGKGGPAAGSGGIDAIIASPRTETSAPAVKEHQTAAVRSPFQIKGTDGGEAARSQESIAEVVDSYKGGISFLYNKALRENPTLRGTVTVEFTISENGDVIECRVVASSMNDAPFEGALVKRLLQWKFPPVPGGRVTILYPIVFSIGG